MSPYLVGMRENTDQKNSEYGQFSRSELYLADVEFSKSRYYGKKSKSLLCTVKIAGFRNT